MAVYDKPLPVINEDNRQYWEYCKRHEFRIQKCTECGYLRFPCSIICPKCHSMDSEWTKLNGKGKVYSYIVYRQVYHPSYKNDIPYVVAIIELDEGPRMESNITGCKIEEIKIGMPVEVYFDDITAEISLPKFRSAEKANN